MINAEDIENGTEAEFEKLLDALPILGEITILQEGEPVAKFISVEEYERLQTLLAVIKESE